jgi:shikimate dehydrogenase
MNENMNENMKVPDSRTTEFRKACVIGHPIRHSRSPLIHGHWLRHYDIPGDYARIDVLPETLASFILGLESAGLAGCNCTLPHKEAVLKLCHVVTPAAATIGAVNTIWLQDGRIHGDNTDVTGFAASLDQEAPRWRDRRGRAMVLGAGGAARAILEALILAGFEEIFIVNRTIDRASALAAAFGARVFPLAPERMDAMLPGIDLLVNTTSLGMAGQPDNPVETALLPDHATVSDIVYVPLETPLVRAARARGLAALGGLGMLLHQAVPGFEHWFGLRPEVTPELRKLIEADVNGN